MLSRRMTRLINAFSKKIENHAHAIALHFLYYNFVRVHMTLRTTPVMAEGVSKRLLEIGDIVDVLEPWEASQSQYPTTGFYQRWTKPSGALIIPVEESR